MPPSERSRPSRREAEEAWAAPSADEYARFRPLLFRALLSLARRDYEIQPDEGLELIHDFFLEAWPGLLQRYDPARSQFSTYVFGAFLRFARPRIAAARAWHERFVGWESIDVERLDAPQTFSETSLDNDAVRQALGALSPPDRDLLVKWLASDGNLRRASRAIGLSRYKTRAALVATLTRLADAMGQRIGSSESDWLVARALWVEGRNVANAAASLDMSAEQVRRARQRIFDFLAVALGAREDRLNSPEGSDVR